MCAAYTLEFFCFKGLSEELVQKLVNVSGVVVSVKPLVII
jgi:hypothetical protein